MVKDKGKKAASISKSGGDGGRHQKTSSTSSSTSPGTPAFKTSGGSPKPSPPRNDSQFTGYNSPHPVLRIYSSPPTASASTSNANATGRIDLTFDDNSHQRTSGSRRNSTASSSSSTTGKTGIPTKVESRPRKSSADSLRRHIAAQPQNSSPLASQGSPKVTPTSSSSPTSPTQLLRSTSSSSSSSLSSMAGPETPDYMNGLRMYVKSTAPAPPVVASDIAFPTLDNSLPHLSSARLSPAHSIESLKSCMREPKESSTSLNVTDNYSPDGGDSPSESPSTRKRRSVSFAVEDPIVHHLRRVPIGNGSNGSPSASNGNTSTILEDSDGPVPFPNFENTSLRRRQPGGNYNDIDPNSATSGGAFFTYMRANTLSTYSSRTSMSSEGWSLYSNEVDNDNDDISCLRRWTETAIGMSLAMGWLAVGRIVGVKLRDEDERAIRHHDE